MTDVDRLAKYWTTCIENALDQAAGAANGNRNSGLNAASFTMGILVREGITDHDTALSGLEAAAYRMEGAGEDDWTPERVRRTIKGGLRDGIARGALQAVLPRFAADWSKTLLDAAALKTRHNVPADEAATARAVRAARAEELELARRATRMREKVARIDLVGKTKQALVGRLPGPKLELADLMLRGIDLEVISAADLGRARWPAMGSEKYPDRVVGQRRSIVIPWYDGPGRQVETIQFRHVEGEGPKYHWLEELGAGILYGGDLLMAAPVDRPAIIVEGALGALRFRSEPALDDWLMLALPSESAWRRAFSKYAAYLSTRRVVLLPDAVAPGSKSVAVKSAHAFADALGDLGRVVELSVERDPDEWLNTPGHGERLASILAGLTWP